MKKDPLIGSNDAFATRAVHSGLAHCSDTGAVVPPIYATSTFEHGNPGGFDYTRSGNPNFRNLADIVAAAEGADYATVFASGVSAITAVVSGMKSGDRVLLEENVYGCTYRLFEQVFRKFGVEAIYTDFTAPGALARIAEVRPCLIWIESPTNPLMKILDIAAIAEAGRAVGADTLVDNTFASSFLQQPLKLGATLSLLSTTKYTNGHSDALGGVVCTDSPEWFARMEFAQKALGLQPSPFDTWLTARGARTQALRMERHSSNALRLAEFLSEHPQVSYTRYPFLPNHPQFVLARQQMRGGSGMVTVELKASLAESLSFCKALRLFTMAESLGGVESLVCHPASMTHASVPREVRETVGITDSLVRFSVGIEDIDDLIGDVRAALDQLRD